MENANDEEITIVKTEPDCYPSNSIVSYGHINMQRAPQPPNLTHAYAQNNPECDIIETIDSDDQDFAEAESLSLIQFKKDEKLCDFYRRMPILYDKQHPHYKFTTKKEKAWRELSRLMDMDVEAVKKRMTYFRCRFTVERRVVKNGVNCSEWPLLEKLKFLNKHIKVRRPRTANEPTEADSDEEHDKSYVSSSLRKRVSTIPQDESKDDLQAYLEFQSLNHNNKIQQEAQFNHPNEHMNHIDSPIPSSNVEVSFTPNPQKRRIIDIDESSNYGGPNTQNRTIKYQNVEHTVGLDEHGAFGLYVGEVLRKLSPNLSALTSLKIMQLLYEAQISPNQTSSSSSTKLTNGIHEGV